MQKRRAHGSSISGLPLTDADVARQSALNQTNQFLKPISPQQRRRRRKRPPAHQGTPSWMTFGIWVFLVIGGTYLGSHYWRSSPSTGSVRRIQQELPLSQFDTLQYALQHSKLVGLYFAAAWCPVSTPVTELIDEHLGNILLPPPSGEEPPVERAPMSIVYVSSDRTEEDFQTYPRRKWISVPFQGEERTSIKKHFSVCAKPEVELLGIDRKFEIPTLIVVDGVTHGVITTNGAEDLLEYQDKALAHWEDLHDLVRAMEDKYGGDEEQHSITHKKRRTDHAESISSLFA